MKERPTMNRFVIGLAIALFISGCAGSAGQGRLDIPPSDAGRRSIEALTDNRQDYDVYYSGYYAGDATSIVFDRKGDGRTIRLAGATWTKVPDPETLTTVIHGIKANNDFSPRVWNVIGPDNRPYGYLYTGWHLINVLSVSENVITIAGIPATYDGYRRH